MSGHYSFQISQPAILALGLARLAIPVAFLSFLLMRFADLHPAIAIYCFATAIVIALLSWLVSIAAFPAIWFDGQKGGRRLWGAFLRGLLVLVPALVLAYYYFNRPAFSDLSTNLENPPIFDLAKQQRQQYDNELTMISHINRQQQARAYPELTGKLVEHPPQLVYLLVKDLIEKNGWTLLGETAPSEEEPNGRMEISIRSIFSGLRYVAIIRLQDDGQESTIVDMRSASLWGHHDFGLNARRIRIFFADMDEKLGQGLKLYQLQLEEVERQERLKRGPLPRKKPKPSEIKPLAKTG
ncbi:MAG: DUF1499 domain-containing protein [Cohaesibacter sp.]|nr:DUF1499 domain-containing protein [Cohaesibacter sp.]MCV6600889.1 DUF1499 domain-containing protein [Cohaesibacter sp.]